MKLDSSSYYPPSPLDDSPYMPRGGEGAPESSGPGQEPDDDRGENGRPEIEDRESPPPCEPPAGDDGSEPDLPPTQAENLFSGVAHGLSWVFVPLLMPVYAALLAFNYSVLAFTGFGTRAALTLIILLFNVGVPSLIVLILKKMGIVKDIGLNNRTERFIPYLIGIICLVGTALFLGYKHAPQWLVWFYMGGAAAGVVEVIVNHWWKISVHAAGIAGVVALLLHLIIFDYTLPGIETWLIISILLAGLLGAARIWLGRHTLAQVLAGYAVGFGAVYGFMLSAPATMIAG